MIEADELLRQVRDAYQRNLPDEPCRGAGNGVVVEVDLDDNTVDIAFDLPTYRVTHTDVLGAAIVAAHRIARQAAFDAREQAIRAVSVRCGITEPDWLS